MTAKSIVFIHGICMTPLCWEPWEKYFSTLGYSCYSPSYPFHEKGTVGLRNHPDPALAGLQLEEVLKKLEQFITGLNEKPILIGHSMGGLITQLLLQKNIAVAGVAIDSAPPVGVFTTKFSFFRCTVPIINPLKGASVYLMPFKHFQYCLAHRLPELQQQEVYDKYIVPESRNVPRGALKRVSKIDFSKNKPPLLMIAGTEDRIIPAVLNRNNFRKYKRSAGKTDFKEFPGRTHYILGQNGWEEVAAYIAAWLKQ